MIVTVYCDERTGSGDYYCVNDSPSFMEDSTCSNDRLLCYYSQKLVASKMTLLRSSLPLGKPNGKLSLCVSWKRLCSFMIFSSNQIQRRMPFMRAAIASHSLNATL
jgi:hypothetical protein